MFGSPRYPISSLSSHVMRRPEIEVSRMAARLPGYVADDVEDAEPLATDELIMDKIQRSTRIGSSSLLDLDDDPAADIAGEDFLGEGGEVRRASNKNHPVRDDLYESAVKMD